MENIYTTWALFLMVSLYNPLFSTPTMAGSTDIVVFSYDRPMQLFAFLESVKTYIKGTGNIFVLMRASNDHYARAYQEVYKKFSDVIVSTQNNATAHSDFKPILCDIVENKSRQDYIVFATDDIIICDDVDLQDCVKHLENTKATGFYLRLGKNITAHYIANKTNVPLPAFQPIAPGILKWQFNETARPWSYPNSVDMTVFKKAYPLTAIKKLAYKAPNSFEREWHNKPRNRKACGLCYEHSKIVNIPLNLVQTEDTQNKNMALFSADDLLKLFNAGFRIDIKKLHQFDNNSVHSPYEPSFIKHN